jgi:hypothetical protein
MLQLFATVGKHGRPTQALLRSPYGIIVVSQEAHNQRTLIALSPSIRNDHTPGQHDVAIKGTFN